MTMLHLFVNMSDLRDSYGGALRDKKIGILRKDATVGEDGLAFFRPGLDFNSTQVGQAQKTIPNQGSRALIIEQTCPGSFSAVSKPIFTSK